MKRLPIEVDTQSVRNIFSDFGQILDISAHSVDTPDPLYWWCSIKFLDVESAKNAVRSMNNKIIVQNTRPIHVKFANESLVLEPNNFNLIPEITSDPDQSMLLPSFLRT